MKIDIKLEQHPDIGRGWWWEVSTEKPITQLWVAGASGFCWTKRGAKQQAERAARRIAKKGTGAVIQYEADL